MQRPLAKQSTNTSKHVSLKELLALRCFQVNTIKKKKKLVLWNKNNQGLNTIDTGSIYEIIQYEVQGTCIREQCIYLYISISHMHTAYSVVQQKGVYAFDLLFFLVAFCVQLSSYAWSNAKNYTTTDTSVSVLISLLCKAPFA